MKLRHRSSCANGTKDSISRYNGLKAKFDNNLFNGGWHEVEVGGSDKFKKNKFNFIDLFSGAGGLSLGLKQAGFNKIISIEIDKDASKTIRKNFPESFHFEGKIEDLSDKQIKDVVGKRKIHVVCGGPPCQGFSVAGLRNPKDPRNQLFREFIRIVKAVKPVFVVLENVPGILTMKNGEVYREIIRQFEQAGYGNMSVRILEAANFGAPQLRTRAVFIANNLGRSNPYPKIQFSKNNYKTIDSAIDDLKDLPPDPSINHEWTRHSKKMEERISKVPPGGSLYSTFRDAWKRQYKGVPSMTAKENHGGVHIHYEKNRVLSARELARLQTFPDDFIFSGTMKRAYWQIGNAVPCILAKNIALAIKTELKKAFMD
jgi:DNA (cytosine-5)-methyltransferase 1